MSEALEPELQPPLVTPPGIHHLSSMVTLPGDITQSDLRPPASAPVTVIVALTLAAKAEPGLEFLLRLSTVTSSVAVVCASVRSLNDF